VPIPKATRFAGGLALIVALSGLLFVLAFWNPSEPDPRLNEPGWAQHHEQVLHDPARSAAELLIVGDSIAQHFESFPDVWAMFAPDKPLNLGFSGDTTANLLWRLQNGEISGLHPHCIVLLVGTNNTARRHPFWTTGEDAAAIEKIVDLLHTRMPAAHILVIGILPSKHDRWKSAKDREINQELAARYAGSTSGPASYVDLSHLLLTPAGDLNQSLYENEGFFLHPNDAGQRLLAEAVLAEASPFEAPTRP
jgi:lysophospholipase L1-like esterase